MKKILPILGLSVVATATPLLASCNSNVEIPIYSQTFEFDEESEGFVPSTWQRGGSILGQDANKVYFTTASENPKMFAEDLLWNTLPFAYSNGWGTQKYKIDIYGFDLETFRCSFDMSADVKISYQVWDEDKEEYVEYDVVFKMKASVRNLEYALEYIDEDETANEPTEYFWNIEPKIFKDYKVGSEHWDVTEDQEAAQYLQKDKKWSVKFIYDTEPSNPVELKWDGNSTIEDLIELINGQMDGVLRIVQSYYLLYTRML